MMLKIRIAFRSVLRNRRRTALSTVMIAGGIAAIGVFQGLTHNLLVQTQDKVVNLQYGHLQVASRKTWNPSAEDSPADRLIDIDAQLAAQIRTVDGAAYSSGRLSFFGLVNNGDQSLSAHGIGYDPVVEKRLSENLNVIDGHRLTANGTNCELVLGSGLSGPLRVKAGDSVTLMSYTFDGAMNAFDCQIVGIFSNGFPELDNVFYLPLKITQKLLATDKIESLVVQLNNTADTDAAKYQLQQILKSGQGLEVKSWVDLSAFYRQLVEFHRMENSVVMWIFMILAMMATMNTVSLAIFERTGEIGTLRALGDSRATILLQFLIEGVVSAMLGGILGCGLGFAAARVLNGFEIPIMIPGATLPTFLQVDILPWAFRNALLMMCTVALLATLLPAYRASKMEIVEALKRNI